MAEGKHLFFLIHGLFGRKGHMESMHLTLEKALPVDTCIVYSSHCNELLSTFDGIEMGAMRIFHELMHFVNKNPVSRISIVGYSMGGLWARYLVGLLQDCGFFDSVQPVNFATFATPHLGTCFWKPSALTCLLNGLARAFLGPSGVDLMSKGPNSILDKMADRHSVYMAGLRRFENLLLFCNAIGDRTVRFWTSFITDKHPFNKTHEFDTEVSFFEFDNNKHGAFLLDLNASKYTEADIPQQTREKKEKTIILNLAYALIPVVFGALALISVVSWIKVGFGWPVLKVKTRSLSRKYRDNRMTPEPSSRFDTEDEGLQATSKPVAGLGEDLHLAAEEFPPLDDEASPETSMMRTGRPITTAPQPFNNKESNIIDETPRRIELSQAVRTRMNNLNELSWKKYAAYIKHFRTHAHIIDRLKEGSSQGSELLRFFAEDVIN